MVDLELYRVFYVVAEEGNITKASEKLHISQPAVTKQIKNLESQLNTPLFIRTKKGVLLNECGQKIFIKVKQALLLLEEASNIVKDYNDVCFGTIRIGTSTTLMKNYLLKYLEIFHSKYPNIVVNVYTDPTKELINKLKSGMIDLIIGKFPVTIDKELNYFELGRTRYIFVANKKYINISDNILCANDLSKYPIILQEYPSNSRISVEKYFDVNNIKIEPNMNIASSNLLIDFVKMGYGIGYVTELYVLEELNNSNLYVINVNPSPESISFGIISLKNNYYSQHINLFIDLLKNKSIK